MVLNSDCVRDVLIYIEKHLQYTQEQELFKHSTIYPIEIQKHFTESNIYSLGDVNYSIEKLIEINYIEICSVHKDKDGNIIHFQINNITWSGHEFLDNIKPSSFWDYAKQKAKSIGSISIKALSQGASFVANLYMTNPEEFNRIIKSCTR